MNILQVSAPKSGSFWLNTILRKTLEQKGDHISYYIKSRPEYEHLKKESLSFKDQAGTDMLDIEENGVYFRVSSLLKEPVPNISAYSKKATLAWTHSTWCNKTSEVFSFFDRKVCIVRDPRDTALSAAKFAFTPYMKQHYPSSYNSVEEYFSAEYERLLEQWVWFYGNYLLHKNDLDLHFVFYENLLKDFHNEYNSLLKNLGIKLSTEEKEKIAEEVSFSSMKEDSPRHLSKGKSMKWVDKFSSEEIHTASEKAGALMDIFGYPFTPEGLEKQPHVPKEIPEQQLKKVLEKIKWRKLH
ncbi:sulfotransferase domain-containing protein [Salinimicrobium terrae]|uniref:sulfotransferase domain-containing protein n=1 Tax=Salinimicrobium terrae TaxID=470866 RepID=UPI00041B6097|nr:sulfotransferase domain-containing protein [Salinimicrobium terrae]